MFYVFLVALASMNLLCWLSNKLCKKYEQNDFYEVFANHFVNSLVQQFQCTPCIIYNTP